MTIFETVKQFLGKKPEPPPEPPKPAAPIDEVVIPITVDRGLIDAASAVVESVELDNSSSSSEAKHAVAFARLSRALPGTPKRDISMLIELALRR